GKRGVGSDRRQRRERQARNRLRLRQISAAKKKGAGRSQPLERQGDQDSRQDHPRLRRGAGLQRSRRQVSFLDAYGGCESQPPVFLGIAKQGQACKNPRLTIPATWTRP